MNKHGEFIYLYNKSHKYVCNFFVIFLKKDKDLKKRVAVVASKKIGNAIDRNKAKRRMREILRLSKEFILPGTSIILVARKPIINSNFQMLLDTFHKLLYKFYTYEDSKQNS
ncbi:ribonuclease P protein component [Desulfurella sp.]|uniref:ribonuclease P protein component n=1 Tax=Desulfurella sp. TaxID=1962857 RepID=UPI003D129771